MKKILPPLTILLLTALGIFIIRSGYRGIELSFISVLFIKGGSISPGVEDISLLILILSSFIILLKSKTSGMFYLSFWVVTGGIVLRKYVIDIIINIKSLSWLPELSISYLTVAIGSMIIILSLIIESRSINE